MKYYDVLEQAGKLSGVSMRAVGMELDHAPNYVSNIKAGGRKTSVDNAARMLDVCGYGLYALPYDAAPTDALQITADDMETTRGD